MHEEVAATGAAVRLGLRKAFGTATTQFFDNLLGNTQLTRQVRLVTKSINPKAQAVWTLRRLHARLSEWAYEIYDSLEHQALGQSPREAFAAGLIPAAIANTGSLLMMNNFNC